LTVKKIIAMGGFLGAVIALIFLGDFAFKVRSWSKERAALTAIQKSDPAFSKLTTQFASVGCCYLEGEVETPTERERLIRLVAAKFGDKGGAQLRVHVTVKKASATAAP